LNTPGLGGRVLKRVRRVLERGEGVRGDGRALERVLDRVMVLERG